MPISQGPSIAHLSTDPLRNFKFLVDITPPSGNRLSLGFMSVSGLNVQVSVVAYREGGYNTVTEKLPGQADFSPVVLSRGVAVGHPEDIHWMKQIFQVMQGTSSQDAAASPNVAGSDFRRVVDIRVLSHPVTGPSAPVSAWFKIYNAWPTALAYSDLDAGTNQLLISQMTLAHEGFDYQLASSTTTDAADPSGSYGVPSAGYTVSGGYA